MSGQHYPLPVTTGDLSCLLLAGGSGRGIGTKVGDRPGPLVVVRGRPFVFYQLDQLADANLRHVVLCSVYRSEQLRGTIGDHYRGLEIEYVREPEPLGTAGAARLALQLARSGVVLIARGDSYCEVDLAAFWRWFATDPSLAAVVLAQVPDAERYGRVIVDRTGRVARVEERGAHQGPGLINAGIYLVPHSWLRAIPPDRPVSLERVILPGWVQRGLRTYRAPGGFLNVGSAESYAEAERFFAT